MTERRFRHLATRREGHVEYVTLDRPEVRNAFNGELVAELTSWATALASGGKRPRVAVLAGAGKVFCAGADVTWMSKTARFTREENLRDAADMSRMFGALNSLPVPLIGRVHGAALGGGAGLAAVCDIVVAEPDAVFGFSEVKLGIIPAVISPFVLAKIGRSAARELFLTGARFSAVRGREIGLVHAVAKVEELDAAIAAYVQELLRAGPEAVAAAKALVRDVWVLSPDEASAVTSRAIAERRVSPEGQEGLTAFLEKRKPRWID